MKPDHQTTGLVSTGKSQISRARTVRNTDFTGFRPISRGDYSSFHGIRITKNTRDGIGTANISTGLLRTGPGLSRIPWHPVVFSQPKTNLGKHWKFPIRRRTRTVIHARTAVLFFSVKKPCRTPATPFDRLRQIRDVHQHSA